MISSPSDSQTLEDPPKKLAQPYGRTARDLALLIALTLGLHVPFVGQAFHLDDVQYLDVAQNVFQNPLFPLDLPTAFEGERVSLWGHTHPPLNSYFIAVLLLLNGHSVSETFLHTGFLIFPILITVSFYFLARRFVRNAFIASALLAATPALVVSAHTVMADVPYVSMWLCAALAFVRGIDRKENWLLYAAGAAATASIFYAYQGLAVIPLLAFYALSRNRLGLREALTLIAPLVFLGGWQLSGYLYQGVLYASPMFERLGQRGLFAGATKINSAVATLTYVGGIILPFPFIFWRMGFRWKGALVWVGMAAAIAVALQKYGTYTLMEKMFFIGCFAGGVVTVLWAVGRMIHSWSAEKWSSDDLFLCLWFVGVLVGCAVAFISGSARYLLPAAPPLLLLFIRAGEQRINSTFKTGWLYTTLLVLQVLISFLSAQSDYEFAAMGRQQAQEFQSVHLGERRHFFFSAEWGLRYYLTAMGGEIMADNTTGSAGDLVIKSRLALGRSFNNDLDRSLELIEQRTYEIRSPVRLLDQRSHAGFWSDGWGVLPFWFSTEPLDEISIYRVKQPQ
jgi:hypothetical protein